MGRVFRFVLAMATWRQCISKASGEEGFTKPHIKKYPHKVKTLYDTSEGGEEVTWTVLTYFSGSVEL